MSFSSLNGDIDVTFPADLRANVKLETDNGDVYTDFDIQMQARSKEPIVEENREGGGRYRVKIDKAVYGAINGGGRSSASRPSTAASTSENKNRAPAWANQ